MEPTLTGHILIRLITPGTLTAPPAGTSTVACPADAVDPGVPPTITDACGNTFTAVLVVPVVCPHQIQSPAMALWYGHIDTLHAITYVDWTYTYTIDYTGTLTAPPALALSTVACAADASH